MLLRHMSTNYLRHMLLWATGMSLQSLVGHRGLDMQFIHCLSVFQRLEVSVL